MARRREESLVAVALSSKWPVSAVIALFFLVLGHVLLPSSIQGNPLLLTTAQVLRPFMSMIAGIFGIIAVGKLAYSMLTSPSQRVSAHPSVEPNLRATGHLPRHVESRKDEQAPVQIRKEPVWHAEGASARELAWSLELLQSIEWKRFEDLCQRFYAIKGIRCACTPLGPDGGIDIRLYQAQDDQTTAIVQCKAWGGSYVGVKPVRELLGVMVHEKVAKAFFMTSGKYSDEAKSFAEPNRITLIDGVMFVAMIKRLPQKDQIALLEFATAGDFTTPTCPTCGTKMHLVTGKDGRRDFWGCSNFPRCRQKLGARRGTTGPVTAIYE